MHIKIFQDCLLKNTLAFNHNALFQIVFSIGLFPNFELISPSRPAVNTYQDIAVESKVFDALLADTDVYNVGEIVNGNMIHNKLYSNFTLLILFYTT